MRACKQAARVITAGYAVSSLARSLARVCFVPSLSLSVYSLFFRAARTRCPCFCALFIPPRERERKSASPPADQSRSVKLHARESAPKESEWVHIAASDFCFTFAFSKGRVGARGRFVAGEQFFSSLFLFFVYAGCAARAHSLSLSLVFPEMLAAVRSKFLCETTDVWGYEGSIVFVAALVKCSKVQ